MNYHVNRLIESIMFAKLVFELKLRNAIDGSVLHFAHSTEEDLEMVGLASEDKSIATVKLCPSELCWVALTLWMGPYSDFRVS